MIEVFDDFLERDEFERLEKHIVFPIYEVTSGVSIDKSRTLFKNQGKFSQ